MRSTVEAIFFLLNAAYIGIMPIQSSSNRNMTDFIPTEVQHKRIKNYPPIICL